jgi:DNA (cytosine-5)-methyltransferase 1
VRKLSLFSGIGGIDLAAHWAGMETVAFCEREPFPQKVLKKHWPNVPIYDDVCTLTAERLKEDGIIGPGRTIDIISAGYPCQPESHAGKRKGEKDDRWLWPEVRRLINEIRPRWFVGENVFGHVSLGLDTVLSDLEGDNYTAEAIVIPAASVGAPQRRDRVFIVAYTEGNSSRGLSIRTGTENTRLTCSGKNVAYTKSERSSKERKNQFKGSEERFTWSDYSRRNRGPTESRLGRVLDGFSARLDEHRWPAGLGQPQFDWEPPRVATDVKDRVGRLKALGNAVNPVQIYPIMAAIKAIDDLL